LKKLDFHKIRSIGAAGDTSRLVVMRGAAARGRPAPAVNLSFTIQPIVHHPERMGVPESGKFARPADPVTGNFPALAFA
jgi:hypothetical protein